jgi:hypothetical protein
MIFRSLIVVSFFAALMCTNPASAATPEEVQELATAVVDESIPALVRKTYYLPSGELNGYQAVFVCDGMRYTLYNSGKPIRSDDPQSAWLAFWVRQDGTSGQKNVDTFSDHGFDGTADFGIDGLRQKEYIPADGTYATNDEHRDYWQKRLDDAVTALLNCIK